MGPSQDAPQDAAQDASQGTGSGENDARDPCQPSAECASQATPTMASCCAKSPKQWRTEITSDGTCTTVTCMPAGPGVEQSTIDLICNQCSGTVSDATLARPSA